MANQDLKILLTAQINIGKSISEINAAISGLEKKVKAIKLKVDIDSKVIETLSNFNKNINQISQSTQSQAKAIKDTSKQITQETKAIKDATDAQRKWNEERKVTTKIGGNVSSVTTTYGNNQNNSKQIVTTASDGTSIKKIVDVENQKKDLANYNKMLDQAYKMNADFNKKAEALDRAHYEALKSNTAKQAAFDKMHYQALQQNRQFDIKAREKANKDANALLATQNKAELQVMNLTRRYGTNVDQSALNNYLTQIKALTPATVNFKSEATRLTNEINKIGANAQASAGHVLNFGEALRTAMVKMPVWLLAGGLVFAPIKGLKEAVSTIIEVDTLMTELHKVMTADTDFNSLLQGSISLANELGRSLNNVLSAAVGFARSGFDEAQTLALTRTATIAQNISELSAEEAMSSITAAMTIFNVEASKSIRIVDSLNEVDNNFATTSKDLAISLNKAGSTAKTFGVTMQEMIGHTTAIGVATRESGAIVGNSLKTIYSRLTTMQPSIDALSAVGISVKDASGEMKSATSIIDELAKKWNGLSAETQQNTAVTLAGRIFYTAA